MHYQKNNIGHFLCGPKTYMVFFISEKKVNYIVKEFPFPSRAQNIVVRNLSSEKKRFTVWVWLPAICRGERSVLIARLLSKCEAGGSDSKELTCYSPPFPALL